MGVFGFRPDVTKLEADRDVPGLVKALQYQDDEVRLRAIAALSNVSSADACPDLISCLKDNNEKIRGACVTTLVAMGESALPLLFNAMGDQSWLVRKGAADALTRLRWSPDDDEIKVCFLFAQGSWDELAGFKKKAIPYLVEGLRDENAGIRKGAARALGSIGDPDGFEPLTRALSDPDPDVRGPAALALGELRDPRAIPFLINLFYDANATIRNEAADALATIGTPAFEPLVAALSDSKTGARLAAIRSLGKMKDPRVIPPLIAKLEDAFPEMRSSAATALGEIGAPALPMAFEVMKKGSRIARLACLDCFAKNLDDRVTGVLAAASKEVDEQVAKKAEAVLRKREGLRVWQTALEEENEGPAATTTAELWNIRQERKAFEQIGSQETDKILAILQDDDVNSRLRAILRRVNESRPVVEALVLILRNRDIEIKRRATEALNRLEGISGNPLLVALNDNDSYIRTVAARNLGRLGCIEAILPLLQHAATDKDSFVAGSSSEAITIMTSLPNLKMPVVDALIVALSNDTITVRAKSAELLGNIGSAVAVPALINLFRDRDETVVESAAEALAEIGRQAFPALAQATYDSDPRTRCGALTALAEFGPKGEAYVQEALKDQNPDVRDHAHRVLAALKNEPEIHPPAPHAGVAGLDTARTAPGAAARPAQAARPSTAHADPDRLISRLGNGDRAARQKAIRALVSMGEPAFRPLVFAVYNPDKAIRVGALQALTGFGTMGAPYIVKALEDPEIEVQHAAYRILNQLDGKYGLPRSGGPALAPGTASTGVQGTAPVQDTAEMPPPPAPKKLYPADLIPRLADNDGRARARAGEVLVSMGDTAFLPLVYAAYHPSKDMRIGALEALIRFGDRGAPHIVRALGDPELDVRHAAYRILAVQDGRFGLPRVGGPALAPGSPAVPEGMTAGMPAPEPEAPPVSLEGITDPSELAGYLDHANKDVQMNAAMALAMMGGAAAPALIEAFTGSKDARATAAEVLGSLGPDAVDPLMAALDDPRTDVVSGAASVLGKLGDRRAVPALVALLDRNAGGTGAVAAEALGYLGDTDSVDALIHALNGNDSELQSGAARALGYIGDERAVSSLIEAMGSEDFSVRRIAIDALTGIGEASIPFLTEALLHSERGVRSGAAECFMQMGHTPGTEQEQINLLVANEEWMELARRGASAVEVLVYFTDDDNDDVRAGAVSALGKAGGQRAVAVLAGILAKDDPQARREAMIALLDAGAKAVPDLVAIQKESDNIVQQQAIGQVLDRIRRKAPPEPKPG